MRPAILQKDSLNRVAFNPTSDAAHLETFYLHVTDPKHSRSLSLRFSLCAKGDGTPAAQGRFGEVQAVVVEEGKAPRIATERWPLGRVQIDPERAGVGMGESVVGENFSQGVVRGENFSITWDFNMSDEVKGYAGLPASPLCGGRGATPKLATAHPGSRVSRGRLEIWHGLNRHVPVTRIDLSGWLGMQGHRWTDRASQHYAWVHTAHFKDAPLHCAFEAFAGQIRLNRFMQPHALLGRLVLGTEVFRFDSWRNLFGEAGSFSPTDWSFAMAGPQGSLQAKVKASPLVTAAFNPGCGGMCFTNPLSTLKIELQPTHGAKRTLVSDRATYEVSQAAPRGAVQSAA